MEASSQVRDWPLGQPDYVGPLDEDACPVVVHLRRYRGKIVQDCDVYIGRKVCLGGWNLPFSKWGNPFSAHSLGDNVPKSVQLYEEYIRRNPHLLNDLPELKGKRLGCWCKPKMCHGDVLIKLYCQQQQQQQQQQQDQPPPSPSPSCPTVHHVQVHVDAKPPTTKDPLK
jgi:hypothetical protein